MFGAVALIGPIVFALSGAVAPPGWVDVAPPAYQYAIAGDDRCGAWQVRLIAGAVTAAPLAQDPDEHDHDSGPPLRLTWRGKGYRHVLAEPGGYLVGIDEGEFGGALYWVGPRGRRLAHLGGDPVRDFLQLGRERVVAFEGVAHLGTDEGQVRWLERGRSGAWIASGVSDVGGVPNLWLHDGDSLYVLSDRGLARFDTTTRRRTAKVDAGLTERAANSLVRDAAGVVWAGMDGFVVRFEPDGDALRAHWMQPRGCGSPLPQRPSR